jgi:addiction module RelB/DinJ family antitoxin
MMATVNFRIDEALKEKSYSILKEQGIAPTDFFTSILEYVATTGKQLTPQKRRNRQLLRHQSHRALLNQ